MTLELVALDKHWAREIAADGNASLAVSCSNFDDVASYLEEAVDGHIALYEKTQASAPWIAYLARLAATRAFVGICSFKDVCKDGRVEIAYYTFPPCEGRGYGRAMAAQLVDLALKHPDVVEVVAHTRARENASTRILRRLRFEHVGTANDPDDGLVWRWVLSRNHADRPARRGFVPMTRASAVITFFS